MWLGGGVCTQGCVWVPAGVSKWEGLVPVSLSLIAGSFAEPEACHLSYVFWSLCSQELTCLYPKNTGVADTYGMPRYLPECWNLNPSPLTFKTHALTSKAISPSPIQSLFYMYAVSKRVACRDMHMHVRRLTGDTFFLPPNRSCGPNSGLVASVLTHWTILLAPNSVFIGFYHIINSPG